MKLKLHLLLFAILVLAESTSMNAQSSTLSANEIIQKSYQAHGGIYATDSLKVAFKFINHHRINEGQSYVVEAPFETYLVDDELWIDKPRQKIVYKTKGTLAGGFVEERISFVDKGRGASLNLDLKKYNENTSLPNPRQLFQNYLLQSANANPSQLKFVAEENIGGHVVYHLTVDTIQVYINAQTFLVDRIVRKIYEPHSGKGNLTIDWQDYKKAGKAMIPQKYITTKSNLVYGTMVNEYKIQDIKSEFEVPQQYLEVPKKFSPFVQGTKDCELRKLAPSIYFIESIDGPGGVYSVIAAEFTDYILITEAPLEIGISRRVIQKVNELFPTKPVRYLVQSHSHYDHIGGILGYSEKGVRIVSTGDAAKIINKMSAAFGKKLAPVIETVDNKWVVKDETNECQVYNIGPNPHSRQILVTYFPKQKILYQADLYDPEFNTIPVDIEFIKSIKKLKLDIKTMVPVHGEILEGEKLKPFIH